MPSTRVAAAVGGGGILRRKDGVILDIQFSTENPLFKNTPLPAGQKKSDFVPLFAILTILEDGKDTPTLQPAKIGGAGDYEVVCDGRGIKGSRPLSKSQPFVLLYSTSVNPTDGGKGFNEELLPEDPEGLVADYSNIRGARVMFDWQKDNSEYAKKNPRKAKDKEGKPLMKDGKQVTYDRENLVIAAYYGQEDLSKLASKAAAAPVAGKLAGAAPAGKATAAATAAVDPGLVEATAEDAVAAVLKVAKGTTLSRNKLSVKLMNHLASADADLREAVRTACLDGSYLKTLEGVVFNADNDMVTLSA